MRYKNSIKSGVTGELGEVRKHHGIAYYHQLYTLLASALSEGVIAPGSALPSESDLMERFDVSRNTVRRALAQLEKERRIVRRRGSGSYARRPEKAPLSPDSLAEVLLDFESPRMQSTSRLVRVQGCATPEFIRRRDPEFGETSMLVQRCRSVKNVPFMFSSSYIPEHIGSRLTRRLLTRHVVLSALESLGLRPSSAEQITTALPADPLSARHLQVEPASALLCIHRLIRDAAGRSIEHQTQLYPPDRYHIRAQVALERSAGGLRWSESRLPPVPAAL